MAETVIAGRYRLIEPLGRGAMSAVWLADDEELGRRVAVKMLAPTADRTRFEREARAAASLSHPNISSLYDYGESDDRPYMVLEYLPGGTLEKRLVAGVPLPEAEVRRIAREIAEGLAHAHSRGLVHRDLKPANILFDGEGHPKIADFGIARMGSSGTLTEAGTVLGTASYISPEQAAGLPAGPASDVYSFGVTAFRMLTGRLPFVAANAMELVRMHRDDPPPAIESVRPDVPADLAAVVTATLAKEPAARPADGDALVRALANGTDATIVLGRGDAGVLRPTARSGRRRRVAPLALAAVAPVVLAGGVAAAWLATRPGPHSNDTPAVISLTLPNVPTGSTGAATFTQEPRTTTPPIVVTLHATTTRRTTAPATTAVRATAVPTPTAPAPTTTARSTTTTTAPVTSPATVPTAPAATTDAVTTAPGTTTDVATTTAVTTSP